MNDKSIKCPQCNNRNTVGKLKPTILNTRGNYYCSKCLVEFTKVGVFIPPIQLDKTN